MSPPADSVPVSLLTINTLKSDGDYDDRLTALTDGLLVLRPDVIACQEAFLATEARLIPPDIWPASCNCRIATPRSKLFGTGPAVALPDS